MHCDFICRDKCTNIQQDGPREIKSVPAFNERDDPDTKYQ